MAKKTQKKKSLNRQSAMYSRIRRRNEFLAAFIVMFDVRCEYCGEPIDPEEFFKWRDDLTLHHVNEDRTNNLRDDIVNGKELCVMHRGCHQKHHKGK